MDWRFVLALLALLMVALAGGLLEHVITERAQRGRTRRQAETQRDLNEAAARLVGQVAELDRLIEQARRRLDGAGPEQR